MNSKAKNVDSGEANALSPISPNPEISLPSFRDGIAFKVKQLNFGGFKEVGRAEHHGLPAVDVMSVMLIETLKREFPNVTEKEVDAMEMSDTMKLTELVTAANEGMNKEDFTPPTSTGS